MTRRAHPVRVCHTTRRQTGEVPAGCRQSKKRGVALLDFAHPPRHVQRLLGNLHVRGQKPPERALRVGRTYSAGQGSHRTVFRHRPRPAGEGVPAGASSFGTANAYLEGEYFPLWNERLTVLATHAQDRIDLWAPSMTWLAILSRGAYAGVGKQRALSQPNCNLLNRNNLAGTTGLEPATSCVTGMSNICILLISRSLLRCWMPVLDGIIRELLPLTTACVSQACDRPGLRCCNKTELPS